MFKIFDLKTRGRNFSEYVLQDGVIFLIVQDGTGRLLNLDCAFIGMSEVATYMLSELLNSDLESTTLSVATKYKISPAAAKTDLTRFVEQLDVGKFILHGANAQPRQSFKKTISRFISLKTLHLIHDMPLPLDAKAWLLMTLAFFAVKFSGFGHAIAIWQGSFKASANMQFKKASPETVDIVSSAVERVAKRHILPVACKERALSAWSLTQHASLPSELIIGVDLFPFAAHTWCTVDTKIVGDEADGCKYFAPVAAFPQRIERT